MFQCVKRKITVFSDLDVTSEKPSRMDWEDHSKTYIRSRSYSKTTATMDFGDSRDSGFGGSRDADETFHGTAPTTPTDFSSLVEVRLTNSLKRPNVFK